MQGKKYMVTSVLKVTTFEVCEIATGLISPNLVISCGPYSSALYHTIKTPEKLLD